jgi:hypothetical protein
MARSSSRMLLAEGLGCIGDAAEAHRTYCTGKRRNGRKRRSIREPIGKGDARGRLRDQAAFVAMGRTKSRRSIVAATPYTGLESPAIVEMRRALALARTRTDVPLSRSAGERRSVPCLCRARWVRWNGSRCRSERCPEPARCRTRPAGFATYTPATAGKLRIAVLFCVLPYFPQQAKALQCRGHPKTGSSY